MDPLLPSELETLREIGSALVMGKDLAKMLDGVFDVMVRRLGMIRGSLVVRQRGILAVGKLISDESSAVEPGIYSLGKTFAGSAADRTQLEIVTEKELSERYPEKTASIVPVEGANRVRVPIRHRQRVIGFLEFDQHIVPNAPYTPEHSAVLMEIVAGLAADVAEARTHQQTERRLLIQENLRLRSLLHEHVPGNMVGTSPEMREVYAQIRQVAPADATVLIRGGSGTGKELVARAIVELSPRKGKPFVTLNCAALPETLIESELFGHERGAFTGAVERRIGRAEAADGGTLFLDEVGDLTPATQVKLLRFLQERTFSRVGSNAELHADVRFIAATSRNLEDLMARKLFREDLYYRLNIFAIAVPDLSHRRGDIIPLVRHFIETFNAKYRKRVRDISPEAAAALLDYRWPGNVRELENAVERAVITATDAIVHLRNLPPTLRPATDIEPSAVPSPEAAPEGPLNDLLDAYETSILKAAMARHGSNLSAAARELGISPRVMYYKTRRLGLKA